MKDYSCLLLARPQNLLAYGEPSPDLASLAAAYAYGIARNHPFVDGNKRTALVAVRISFTEWGRPQRDTGRQISYLREPGRGFPLGRRAGCLDSTANLILIEAADLRTSLNRPSRLRAVQSMHSIIAGRAVAR